MDTVPVTVPGYPGATHAINDNCTGMPGIPVAGTEYECAVITMNKSLCAVADVAITAKRIPGDIEPLFIECVNPDQRVAIGWIELFVAVTVKEYDPAI